MNVDRALDYVQFITERHRAWAARRDGLPQDQWTSDPIVRSRKFTNVFRILDPGTQVLMRDGFLEGDPSDVLMRCFLYRHTGRPEVWDWLVGELLGQPGHADLDAVHEALNDYRGPAKPGVIPFGPGAHPQARPSTSFARTLFTGAYMIYPGSSDKGTDKLVTIIDLTRRLFTPASPEYVGEAVVSAVGLGSPDVAFKLLRSNRGVADFMSMQILTDYGYGPGRLDDTFVVCGPGAVRGAAHLGLKPAAALTWAASVVPDDIWLPLPDGRRHRPSTMDLQNTLCEFSKYVRHSDAGRTATTAYRPAHPGAQPMPALPAHW